MPRRVRNDEISRNSRQCDCPNIAPPRALVSSTVCKMGPLSRHATDTTPKVTEFWTELGQNEALFTKYKALRASTAYESLSPARKRIVENALRDFRLASELSPVTLPEGRGDEPAAG